MDADKQKALEAAGWRFGDAADFLGLSDQERQLLDARVEAAVAVRRQRQARKLSQQELADRLKTSQPRIAKIERAARDVSLDQILRAFTAAGGRLIVKQVGPTRTTRNAGKKARTGQKKANATPEPQTGELQLDLIATES